MAVSVARVGDETVANRLPPRDEADRPAGVESEGCRRVALDTSGDLRGFFQELLTAAVSERGTTPTDAAQAYVVALLADYAKPGSLSRDTIERPFTLLLAEALETAGSERFERLRALGDGALYVRGFFHEFLENRGVALGYVSTVGARAYDGAAAMLRRASSEASSAPDVLGELAERFDAFVELLGSVGDRLLARGGSNTDVLRLYERWLRTGSTDIAGVLSGRGLTPLRSSGGLH